MSLFIAQFGFPHLQEWRPAWHLLAGPPLNPPGGAAALQPDISRPAPTNTCGQNASLPSRAPSTPVHGHRHLPKWEVQEPDWMRRWGPGHAGRSCSTGLSARPPSKCQPPPTECNISKNLDNRNSSTRVQTSDRARVAGAHAGWHLL